LPTKTSDDGWEEDGLDYRKKPSEEELGTSPTSLQPEMTLRVNDYGKKCVRLNKRDFALTYLPLP